MQSRLLAASSPRDSPISSSRVDAARASERVRVDDSPSHHSPWINAARQRDHALQAPLAHLTARQTRALSVRIRACSTRFPS